MSSRVFGDAGQLQAMGLNTAGVSRCERARSMRAAKHSQPSPCISGVCPWGLGCLGATA